jgi:very-short-patch-repair endonuclease
MTERRHHDPPRRTATARELRREMTGPERALWRILRGRRLGGLKFRRQVVIGRFVVDFACVEAKLVVEVDGMTHVGRGDEDDNRTQKIESEGWRVIRFTKDEALQHEEAVACAIARAAGLDW